MNRLMIPTVTAMFAAAIGAALFLTGSLATTGLIVLGWLGAGLAIGLLMAWGRR